MFVLFILENYFYFRKFTTQWLEEKEKLIVGSGVDSEEVNNVLKSFICVAIVIIKNLNCPTNVNARLFVWY